MTRTGGHGAALASGRRSLPLLARPPLATRACSPCERRPTHAETDAEPPVRVLRRPVAQLRLFAAARRPPAPVVTSLPGTTVADVLAAAVARYGPGFAALLPSCQVWRNGDVGRPVRPGERRRRGRRAAAGLGRGDVMSERRLAGAPARRAAATGQGRRRSGPAGPRRRRPGPTAAWPSSTTSTRPTSASACAWFLLVLVALALGTYVLAVVYAATAALAGYQAARCWRQRRPNRPDPCSPPAPPPSSRSPPPCRPAPSASPSSSPSGSPWCAPASTSAAPSPTRPARCSAGCGSAAPPPHGVHPPVRAVRRRRPAAGRVGLRDRRLPRRLRRPATPGRARSPGPSPCSSSSSRCRPSASRRSRSTTACSSPSIAAVLCPLGQLLGSLVLPTAAAPASAVRRLDSLLLLAPVWAVAAGALAAAQVVAELRPGVGQPLGHVVPVDDVPAGP